MPHRFYGAAKLLMNFTLAVTDLKSIFTDAMAGTGDFIKRTPLTATQFFVRRHLPLLILYPICSTLAPYTWLKSGDFSIKSQILFPVLLPLVIIVLALVYDKISEYARLEPVEDNIRPLIRNVSSFLHLPLSGSALFFLIHPLIGYLMILTAAIYSIYLSIRAQAVFRRVSYARAIVHYISAAFFLFIPGFLMLFIINISLTIQIFQRIL